MSNYGSYNSKELEDFAAELRRIQKCYVLRHQSPDGDAIGSQFGLVLGLRSLGINAQPLHTDPVPEAFLYITDEIPVEDIGEAPYICVDSMKAARLQRYSEVPIEFCIDHHEKNSIPAHYKYVEEDASSCAQIIFKLLKAMDVEITPQIARFLYIGLMSDPDCFCLRSTNADSLAAAASMAACGINVSEIARRHCFYKSRERIEAEKCMMSTLHFTYDDRVLSCMLTWEDYCRIGVSDVQLEGINTAIEQIEGPLIAIVLREKAPGICRFSLRAENGLNAAEICMQFNGGGHSNAAGCEIEDTPQNAMRAMERACADYLKEKGI